MSQNSQKQMETLEHIYMSLQNILKVLEDLRTERGKLIEKVNIGLKPIMEDPTRPDLIPIEILMGALEATPTKEPEDKPTLVELTTEIIDITFKIKKSIDTKIYTEDIVKKWIKSYIKRVNLVLIEQDTKLYDYINKLFQLLGAFRTYIEDEDEGKEKDNKKDKEKKPKAPKTPGVRIGD